MLSAYEMGKAMNLTTMQQEAYVMACLETAKIQTGSPLDRIHSDVGFNGKEITPIFYSWLALYFIQQLLILLIPGSFDHQIFIFMGFSNTYATWQGTKKERK